MHIYFLKEIYQLMILQLQVLLQIILIKKVILKNFVPFTNYRRKINNTQIDNAEYINIVMPMYNLIDYSDNYSKTSGRSWQYCKEILVVVNAECRECIAWTRHLMHI